MNSQSLWSFLRNSLLFLFVSFKVLGQEAAKPFDVPTPESLVKVPNSPEAQAFAKYGNTSVSMYTGSPDIAVPITTLQGRSISIPISLTYDASGVRLEQIATWVGLNWNLAAGGAVTRQANGSPDDYISAMPAYEPFYYGQTKADYDFLLSNTYQANQLYPPGELDRYFDLIEDIQEGDKEFQPDVYSFSINGLSGSMVIDYENETATCIERPEIKVQPYFGSSGAPPQVKLLTGWKIIDANGTQYLFMRPEKTTVYDMNGDETYKTYYSSWFISQIVTANARDIVDFVYSAPVQWDQPQLAGRGEVRRDNLFGGDCPDQVTIPIMPTYKIAQFDLQQININGVTRAVFESSPSARLDLEGKKSLRKISVYALDGTRITTALLHHSYFESENPIDEKHRRLRLDAVEFSDEVSATPLPSQFYRFSYQAGFLPSRESYSLDFWGYYNGAPNTTLIPFDYDYDQQNGASFQGADRKPNFLYSKIGALYKVKYPTGGTTEYSYISHKSSVVPTTYKRDRDVISVTLNSTGDSYNFYSCDPELNLLNPKIKQGGFSMPEMGNVTLRFVGTGPTGSHNGHFQYAIIYSTEGPRTACPPDNPYCDALFRRTPCELFNESGHPYFVSTNMLGSFDSGPVTLTLPAGGYGILLVNSNPEFTLQLSVSAAHTYASEGDKMVGGLRVYKVTDKTEAGIAQTRYFYYGDFSKVSGNTNLGEEFFRDNNPGGTLQQWLSFTSGSTDATAPDMTCPMLVRTGSNRVSASNLVTYPQVTEIAVESSTQLTNGYTVFIFYDFLEGELNAPGKRTTLGGKLSSKKIYTRENVLLEKTHEYYSESIRSNIYTLRFESDESLYSDRFIRSLNSTGISMLNLEESDPESHYELYGYVGIVPPSAFNDGGGIGTAHCMGIDIKITGQEPPERWFGTVYDNIPVGTVIYNAECKIGPTPIHNRVVMSIKSFLSQLDSTQTTIYSGTDSLVRVKKNFYENAAHYQLTRVEERSSDGSTIATKFYYPSDVASNSVLEALIQANRIAEPIRIEAYNDATLLETKVTDYSAWQLGANTAYLPMAIRVSTGLNPLETRLLVERYDNASNPVCISKTNNEKLFYVWGNNGNTLLAQLVNARSGFHTSFEEEGNSTEGDSRTGAFSKRMTGTYSAEVENLMLGRYMLSYWYKSSGVWILSSTEVEVTGTSYTIEIPGSLQLDEIRFHPLGSTMHTYAYKRGQLISQTDANQITTSYVYDGLGRLVLVKDNEGNVLKKNIYHYKGE